MTLEVSPETTVFLSYEYADHERFIDRGIPTLDGSPDESLSDIVFGNSSANLQTLEATIMRAQVEHMLSDTSKANLSFTSSSFEKLYQNIYGSGYDGTLVTMDGYYDPTERDNTIISGNLVNDCLLYTSPSPRDRTRSRMPSSA